MELFKLPKHTTKNEQCPEISQNQVTFDAKVVSNYTLLSAIPKSYGNSRMRNLTIWQ